MIGSEVDSGFMVDLNSMKHLFTEVQPLYVSKSGISVCYKAKRDGKWFILKAIKPEYHDAPMVQKMWDKEFDYSYNCDHPNIARTYSREQVEGLGDCIVQEFIDGLTLKDFIEAGYMTRLRASRVISELCSALSYIHCKQIVHRDLRPENIMITSNGNHVKLIDFGFADSRDSAIIKAPAGTPKYVSPEVLAGKVPDGRSDIYALGVLIYDMFNDKPRGTFKKVAKRCLAEDRADRYNYADEVYRDLIANNTYLKLIIVPLLIIFLGVIILVLLPKRGDEELKSVDYTNLEIVDARDNTPESLQQDTLVVNRESVHNEKVERAKQINGEILLSYGKYVGEILDGVPHGKGSLTYNEPYLINSNDSKLRYSEKGDTFIGKFYAGVPEYGKLYNSQKQLKATMNFGRTK